MTNKLAIAALLTLLAGSAWAQDPGAPPGIYMSGDALEAGLAGTAGAAPSAGGAAVTVAPGISIRRRSSSVPQYAVVHPYSIEIYRILEGSGTFVTGGKLNRPLAESTDPNIVRTEQGIEGGLARQVKAGDVLVLQPGTPHWFRSIDGESITYMESRIQITSHPVRYD